MSDSPKFILLPTPDKSLIDKKNYRVIQLQNGLTATLVSDLATLKEGDQIKPQIEDDTDIISDSDSEECEDASSEHEGSDEDSLHENSTNECVQPDEYLPAAAIRIGAGSLEDPKDRGGLMHFLEHMVFMGSKKYPKESFFEAFIQKHGGSDNGYTELECTTFYFEIQEQYLKKGLDVFAQFFISPLIMKEAITREKKAVHSEFQLAQPDDDCRVEHFYGTLAKGDHPLSTFMWGNDQTLDFNISDEELQSLMFNLWKKYYSAEQMKLVVQARESLDTLQEWVTEIFSKVPNNQLPRPCYDHLPFPWEMDRWHKFYGIVPIKEVTAVHIAWALPSLQSKYRCKPLDYISHLVGDEGVGSVVSFLRKKMLALELIAGAEDDDEVEHNSIFSTFKIIIHLTADGLKEIDTVLLTVFQYLNLMRSGKPVDRIFEECQKINDMAFNYESEDSACQNVDTLVTNMMLYPPKNFVNGSQIVFDYEPEEIMKALSLLTPDKCNIIVQSKQYGKNELATETEKWFGIKYFSKDISSEWKEMWSKNPINTELAFPPPNPYVTTDFSLLIPNSNASDYPVKIKDNNFGELWYKQDIKFKLPKGFCYVSWINKDWCRTVRKTAAINLFIRLYNHIYSESLYPINLALFGYSISQDDVGLIIKLDGFNENLVKCLQLLRTQMSRLMDVLDEKTFIHIKKDLLKHYHNCLISPNIIQSSIRLNILLENCWQTAEKFLEMEKIDFKTFHEEMHNFMDNYYTKVLVQGNFTVSQAEEMFDIMVSKTPSPENKLLEIKTRKLLPGSWAVRVPLLNQANANSAVVNYYQGAPGNMWTEVVNQFLLYLMSEPAFDFLRTKETLGYSVSCSNRCTYGILAFSVTVNYQANKHNVDLVDSKIEEFLLHFKMYLKKMNSLEFNEFLNSFGKNKLAIDLALCDEVGRNWEEILSGEYVFDRCQRHFDLIPKITKENVLSRLSLLASAKNENYRKISIQIEGSEHPDSNQCPEYEDSLKLPYESIVKCIQPEEIDHEFKNRHFVKDINIFRNSLQFHPVTKIL